MASEHGQCIAEMWRSPLWVQPTAGGQRRLCRQFKQSIEISPHQSVIQQRLERAKQLMRQSDLSIAKIAIPKLPCTVGSTARAIWENGAATGRG